MLGIIKAAFSRKRSVIMMLAFLLLCGVIAYSTIPKEAEPDIPVPFMYVSIPYDGISPEDAERLLVRPMEKELKSISGIKEIKSTSIEGHASILLEFYAGFDSQKALEDVRLKVDSAKSQLPADTKEPTVHEVNLALFPVLTVSLSGPIPENTLIQVAKKLKDKIESVNEVLKVDIGGNRESLVEVIVEPSVLESYGINFSDLYQKVNQNNVLVAAGAIDTGSGRMVLKVPGLIQNLSELLAMPIKVDKDKVVTIQDIATVKKTYKDATGFVRVNGHPAVTLEVSKRMGANLIQTVASVQKIVESEKLNWPHDISVSYMQDKSQQIHEMLSDLSNNIVSAILLVMVVIIATLGVRSSLLVGLAIPGSFLTGILIIKLMGFTLNTVVLFSLILVVGMLVDGAIVVLELADRYLQEGVDPKAAFMEASQRMAWPVISSTATTLAVFLPLMFWPGMVGQFMRFLPITVSICLLASLVMALIFIPVVGAVFTRSPKRQNIESLQSLDIQNFNSENVQPLENASKFTLWYAKWLKAALHYPGRTLKIAVATLIFSYVTYGFFGHGLEFFPSVEPDLAQVVVHARGDLSIYEKDAILAKVEKNILGNPEIKSVYSRSFMPGGSQNRAEDTIGVIQIEFVDWNERRKAQVILSELEAKINTIPGIVVEFIKEQGGPSGGKPVYLQIASNQTQLFPQLVHEIKQTMQEIGGFKDIEDNLGLPGVEWRLKVDREQAARFGADMNVIGSAVQLITNGLLITKYRPNDTDDEVDIRLRLPFETRHLSRLDSLTIPTARGMVPISNFVSLKPSPRTSTLNRVDGKSIAVVQANVTDGVLVDNQVRQLKEKLAIKHKAWQEKMGGMDAASLDISFKGEDLEQRETGLFLVLAFLGALFLMVMILVTQFNSLYQTMLVMSAIVISTSGVLIGLMVTGRPFGIVMSGIGVIALAGIVVNNNIILIDSYNVLRKQGLGPIDAAYQTGLLRLRPVCLTAFTTVLGLMPMVLTLNLDFIHRQITIGAPSTQWWTQLSSSIAGGLSFATVLTLILTPCLLVLGDNSKCESITAENAAKNTPKPSLLKRFSKPVLTTLKKAYQFRYHTKR